MDCSPSPCIHYNSARPEEDILDLKVDGRPPLRLPVCVIRETEAPLEVANGEKQVFSESLCVRRTKTL